MSKQAPTSQASVTEKRPNVFLRVLRPVRGFIDKHPRLNYLWRIIFNTIDNIFREQVPRMAATASYWLLVTIAPLLLFAVSIFSFLNQQPAADIVDEVSATALPTGVASLSSLNFPHMLSGALKFAGPFASIASVVMVLWGALAVFRQLVWALDVIWKKPMPQKLSLNILRANGLSALFFAVLSVAIVLVVSTSTVLTNLAGSVLKFLDNLLGVQIPEISNLVPFFISISVAALFFLVVFWIVPGKRARGREVFAGALITSIFYGAGQVVFTRAISNSHRYDVYGAFAVFVALIVFIYYMAIIVLGGSVLTREIVRDRERYGRDHIRKLPQKRPQGTDEWDVPDTETDRTNPFEKTLS